MNLHTVLPARLSEEVARRKLWPVLPRPRPRPPEGPPRLALSFDLDYQADTDALPALTDLVDEAGARMTVFAIGKLAEADPAAYAEAHARGHEIANHSWSHPDNPVLNPYLEFWHLSEDEMVEEIARGQEALAGITGVRPTGFRTPHFKDAAPLRAALRRIPEIRYASSSLASRCPVATPFVPEAAPRHGDQSLNFPARRPDPDDLLMIPLTPCPGVRWSPFSSYLSIRRPANRAKGAGLHDLPTFEALWRRMLAAERMRGFASVYFDPLDVMRDAETAAVFRRMLEHARDTGWDITTLTEIERLWRPLAAPERAGTAA